MANYNKMAMNIGFTVLLIYILIKAIIAIFDFYGISPVTYLNYILFFVALGLFGGILPNIRGAIFFQ